GGLNALAAHRLPGSAWRTNAIGWELVLALPDRLVRRHIDLALDSARAREGAGEEDHCGEQRSSGEPTGGRLVVGHRHRPHSLVVSAPMGDFDFSPAC